MFCTQCNNNWARLETSEGDGEEQYDVCPKCKTDLFLSDTRPGGTVVMCQFTGEVFNPAVGMKKPLPKPPLDIQPIKSFDREAWEKKIEESYRKENEALELYHALYDTECPEAARRAYFESLKK